jgi:hypothetical protein
MRSSPSVTVREARGARSSQVGDRASSEYRIKGFTMNDERLTKLPGPDATEYFDEQLEWIRDIRASERRFYQKLLDIYSTVVYYARQWR